MNSLVSNGLALPKSKYFVESAYKPLHIGEVRAAERVKRLAVTQYREFPI